LNANIQKSTPVKIAFDTHSKRIDMLSGLSLPDYTLVERGSVRFYDARLDNPVDTLCFMFAAMSRQQIDSLALLRKLSHPNIWSFVSKRGDIVEGLNPVMSADIVKMYAVSFIPLNPSSKKPAAKVHVLLTDMYSIQWGEVDSWLANKSQTEYEAQKGSWY